MRRVVLALIAALTPVTAHATGSAGAFAELQYLPRYGSPGDAHEAPGWIGCAGAVGYGVSRTNLRIGGEAAWCKGLDEGLVSMNYGGLQIGRWYRAGFVFFSFHGSVGFGSLVDRKVLAYQDDPYVSVFFYGKPTFSLGLPMGFMGLETGVFANFPINLAQFVGSASGSRGLVNPTVGIQVSLTFGNFKDPVKRKQSEATTTPSTTPAPVAPAPVTPSVAPTQVAPAPVTPEKATAPAPTSSPRPAPMAVPVR